MTQPFFVSFQSNEFHYVKRFVPFFKATTFLNRIKRKR